MSSSLHPFPTASTDVSQQPTKFLNDLQAAVRGFFPTGRRPYKAVKVIFCLWDDMEFAWLHETLNILETVLRDVYGFVSLRLILKTDWDSAKVARWLVVELMKIVNSVDDQSLIIFYYAGHGELSGPTNVLMLTSAEIPVKLPDGSTADYARQIKFHSVMEVTLELSESHTLYILDCCYASAAALRVNSELIAATAMENLSVPGSSGFSRVLTETLMELNGASITAAQLHAKLMKEATGKPGFGLTFTPIHAELHQGMDGSITIASLLPQGPSNVPPHLRTPRPDPTKAIFTSDDPKVIIRVRLQTDRGIPDVDFFKRWLGTNMPPYIKDIDIELSGWNIGRSSTLLITLPVAVWDVLRPHDAYSFVDYVRSNNLVLQRPEPTPGLSSGALAVRPRQLQENIRPK